MHDRTQVRVDPLVDGDGHESVLEPGARSGVEHMHRMLAFVDVTVATAPSF
jgi:hypothetical protein